MATTGSQYLDLAEIRKGKLGTAGQLAGEVINMMSQTNCVLDDAVMRPCNKGSRHLTTVLSGLPGVTWGRLYQGIPNDRAKRTQVEDVTGFIEGLSTVDARLASLEPNIQSFRLQEAQGYIESLGQEWARSLFYESEDTNPDRITGLAPRFSDLSAPSGSQVVDAGGTGGDNTSIWFVTWGSNATHLIYPSSTKAGITRDDCGKQRVLDDNGNAYYALEEKFCVHTGLTVRDWRKVARIANIDVSAMRAGTVDLYDFMRKAFYKLHGNPTSQNGTATLDSGNGNFIRDRVAIYCNADVFEALDAMGSNSGSSDNFIRLTPREIQGEEVLTYRGIPVRRVDQIHNAEARVQ